MDEQNNTMPVKSDFTHPDTLTRCAFKWSELRMLIAAAALALGGIPPITIILGFAPIMGIVSLGLKVAYLITGVASAYLLYRWYQADFALFADEKQYDKAAFGINIFTGLHLGFAGLYANIGMMVISSHLFYIAAAVVYVVVAVYLWRRWKESGEKLFVTKTEAAESEPQREPQEHNEG